MTKVETDWSGVMKALGIDPNKVDSDATVRQRYFDERVKFLTTRRYAQRIWGRDGFNTRIREREIKIGSIRRTAFPDDDYAQLYSMYESCLDEQVIRPRQPELEIKHNWDAFTIQDPTHFAMPAVFDISVGTSSIVDPRTILNAGGTRGFSVDYQSSETHDHDRSWGVSGSASYVPFISGTISTSNADHFRSTIKKVRQVDVAFKHVGELQIIRDNWFASSILGDNKRVKEFLKKRPALAKKLSILTTGLFVGRGLTLTLTFKDSSDVQEWGSSSASGGGGVDVFGIRWGGSGGSSSSYNNHQIDTVNKTVTFKDDDTVCRLVGLRTTMNEMNVLNEDLAYDARPIWEIPRLQAAAEAAIIDNQIPNLRELLAKLAMNKDKLS